MSKKLNLKIITPQKILVDEQVDTVFSKSITGKFGILPDHVSYMTDLDIGVTEYKQNNNKEFISTMGGVIQVKDNIVTILTDTAELGKEIDVPRAREAKERAETKLKTGITNIEIDKAQVALARAITRIHAASKKY